MIADRALALPPLNAPLARELVARTRVAKLLAGYRDRPAADREAIFRVLIEIILPYPRDLEEETELDGHKVLLRPIRPEDELAHREFFTRLKPQDVRFRFFGVVKALDHSQLACYTQIDYAREVAFIAVSSSADNGGKLGVVRAVCDPDKERAEFANAVRSDMKGRGLGAKLLDKLIRNLRSHGIGHVVGKGFAGNERMLALAKRFGFHVGEPDDGI